MTDQALLFIGAETQRATRITREANAIEKELDRSQIEFRARHDCTFDDLVTELFRVQPSMLHIACHGDREALHFKDGEVSYDDVLEELSQHGCLKCIVLSVCYSAALAERLAAYATVTVGMREAISDTGAIAFSTILYRTLTTMDSVRASHAAGVRKLRRTKGLKTESTYPAVFPALIDAPRRPSIAPAPVAPTDGGAPSDDALRAILKELLSNPQSPEFADVLAGRGPIAAKLLNLNAEGLLKPLMAVVRQNTNLKGAARTLVMHLLPKAIDWAEFEANQATAQSADQPHLVLPFSNAPLCELVAARIQGRPARLNPDGQRPDTHIELPSAARVGLLDTTAIATTLTENILVKAGMPVPDLAADRLSAANTALRFKRDHGGKDGERLQMHLVFTEASPGAVAAVRKELDALFLIKGSKKAHSAVIFLFLQQLFEWETP